MSGTDFYLQKSLSELISLLEPGLVWIIDSDGNVVESSKAAKKILEDKSTIKDNKHKLLRLFKDFDETKKVFRSSFGLKDGISALFSASQIELNNKKFLIIKPVTPEVELDITPQSLVETEFGIYSWHFHLDENLFILSEEAAFKFLGKRVKNIDYQDFYTSLSIESLDRFSIAMEKAINLKQGFELEILIENPGGSTWVKFICKSALDNENGQWLTGLIKDSTSEQKEIKEKRDLNLWLDAGLNEVEVKSVEGSLLAKWGNSSSGRGSTYENGKRISTIYDFRNKPKFTVSSDIQSPTLIESNKNKEIEPKIQIDQKRIRKPSNLDSFHTKDEKFIAITKHLGISLDVQVSAIGIFDGSRFEWKAWWKSPNQHAMPVKKYGGEWLPELDWLVDVESENQKFPERYWWPQDMLPFQISKSYGEGWMIIAEPISKKETSFFAIKTNEPEQIKKKTNEVLQSLDALKGVEIDKYAVNEVEKLHAEIAEKDLLIKEINHRAKNNLAMAASLVKMEASYSESPNALFSLKQTQKRLEALASIHELMYKNPQSNEQVDMQKYLTQLIEGLVASFGNQNISLDLQVDSIEMPIKKASTIGLLVNELVSNAFKYAFSSIEKGVLKVDFLLKGDLIKLRVADNGPGIQVNEKSAESLGKILIEEFVKQLQGTLEIENSNGTIYLISFS